MLMGGGWANWGSAGDGRDLTEDKLTGTKLYRVPSRCLGALTRVPPRASTVSMALDSLRGVKRIKPSAASQATAGTFFTLEMPEAQALCRL